MGGVYNEIKNIQCLNVLDLPDEILLKIAKHLCIKDLLKCAQTCQRIRVICYDETLWYKINLCDKKVPTSFIQHILENGCRYLSLNGAELVGSSLSLKKESKLKYLDLDNCQANYNDLQELLASCHNLQKLSVKSLKDCEANLVKCICLQNGQTLEVLNLEHSTFDIESNSDLEAIQYIVNNCVNLIELSFVFNNELVSQDSITYFVNNLTPKVIRIC